ncbi:MAG: beta-phosphoglucomutase [Victivallaceae bacterium]|nr:beta-phosphoglucomutase [Victivallaceae bacterium]
MPKLKAVIFDLDGVITCTDEYHYLAWKKLFDRLGIEFSRRENEQLKGIGRRESFELIAGGKFSGDKVDRYLREKNEYYIKFLDNNKLSPLPGITKLLEQLNSAGISKAVASGSRNAPQILNNLGMTACFEAIVDGSMCTKSKPAPDLFLLAAEKLCVSPAECVVVEDSQAGIQAAADAGMKSIGIGNYLRNADFCLADTRLLDISIVLSFNF